MFFFLKFISCFLGDKEDERIWRLERERKIGEQRERNATKRRRFTLSYMAHVMITQIWDRNERRY